MPRARPAAEEQAESCPQLKGAAAPPVPVVPFVVVMPDQQLQCAVADCGVKSGMAATGRSECGAMQQAALAPLPPEPALTQQPALGRNAAAAGT